jgi:hypothetical protein
MRRRRRPLGPVRGLEGALASVWRVTDNPRRTEAWLRRGLRAELACMTDEQLATALDDYGMFGTQAGTLRAAYRAALHEARRVRGFTVVSPVRGGTHALFRPLAPGR